MKPAHRDGSSTSTLRKDYKRTYRLYGIALTALLLFSYFIHGYRTVLPTPLSDAQARDRHDFAGYHAYNEYLTHFTAPHSANTRENGVMRDFIASVAYGFQAEATKRGLTMDVVGNDTTEIAVQQDWFVPNEHWFVRSRNVMVRLHGQTVKEDALLVNAHYDSVPSSNGVTDNGMGVSVALELIRYFIDHPPRNTIIFLFNNFEEGGLIGAKAFANHPWYSTVKLFINLEGAGAGGRAIMFRSSNLNAVQKIARSSAALKHASPLGNDMFRFRLLKSDTDFSVFTGHGIPGVDIAFYSPRSHYHTVRDDLAHTSPHSVQYMGQIVLKAMEDIANSDDLLETSHEQELYYYYDLLGRVMFAYSFTTAQFIHALALVLVPLVSIFLFMRKEKARHQSLGSLLKEKACLTVQGLLASIAAFIFALVFLAIASLMMVKINPSMTYGDIYGAALYIFAAVLFGIQLSQIVLPQKMKQNLVSTDAIWYGNIGLWWLSVVVAAISASFKIATFYVFIHIFVFNALAFFAHLLLPQTFKWRSAIIFVIQMTVPFILLLELVYLIMDALRHATADGTPEIAIYMLMGVLIIFIALPLLPWIYVAGNHRQATAGTGVAFIFLFTICTALQPFNGDYSPNKLIFKQEYNAGDSLATVIISTATGLYSILKQSLSTQELNSVDCSIFNKYLTRCTYQTDLLPMYGSNSTLNEFVLSDIQKTCDELNCVSSGYFTSKNSLMCRIHFEPAANEHPIEHIWVKGMEYRHDNISSIITYVNEYEEPVTFAIEYPKNKPLETRFSCFYDEWIHQEVPAFTTLRDALPENAVFAIRGQGLALVHYKNVTL
ncbi:hypothetical protein BDF20DRAFT_817440 [Mycotypha africana]|uniref:uncharacterized protein n=1 Tax=Mycotypha africana TaxID=64632 RepID=UPI002300884B|nr:uncharacterized protein BDF20DRAFT_817440 [Mycotypha africana]KAI8981705.1 hypothetical protein BDF20DRAFT_817440 [Mycotypha africana]